MCRSSGTSKAETAAIKAEALDRLDSPLILHQVSARSLREAHELYILCGMAPVLKPQATAIIAPLALSNPACYGLCLPLLPGQNMFLAVPEAIHTSFCIPELISGWSQGQTIAQPSARRQTDLNTSKVQFVSTPGSYWYCIAQLSGLRRFPFLPWAAAAHVNCYAINTRTGAHSKVRSSLERSEVRKFQDWFNSRPLDACMPPALSARRCLYK